MAYAYGLLVVVHVASIAVAFGALATSPILLGAVRRDSPPGSVALVRAQRRLGSTVVAPAATLTLLTGVALATVGGYWGELWVSLPLSLLVFVLTLHGAFVVPTQRRLEALAAEPSDPDSIPSPAYDGVAKRLAAATYLSSAAILLAMALMVLKPS